jgi:hypothetical protein
MKTLQTLRNLWTIRRNRNIACAMLVADLADECGGLLFGESSPGDDPSARNFLRGVQGFHGVEPGRGGRDSSRLPRSD